MSRVHDMGGRFGTGPIDVTDGATFVEEWHKRALALNLASGALGQWNIDTSRHFRELLSAKDYSGFSYYEKWMAGLTDLMVDKGVLSEGEVKAGHASGRSELADRAMTPERVAPALAAGSPYDRAGAAPKYGVGDVVKARRPACNLQVEGGHTRLPAYAAGAQGDVVLCHGNYIFPDSNAHGLGENPEPLYAVRFSARALWGPNASEADEVILDLWESYLEGRA